MYYGHNTGVPSPLSGPIAPGSPARVASPSTGGNTGTNMVSPSMGYAPHNASPLYSNVMARYPIQVNLAQKLQQQQPQHPSSSQMGNLQQVPLGMPSGAYGGVSGAMFPSSGGQNSAMVNGIGQTLSTPLSPGMHPSSTPGPMPVATVALSSHHQQMINLHHKSRQSASPHYHARTTLAASRSSHYNNGGNDSTPDAKASHDTAAQANHSDAAASPVKATPSSSWTAIDLGGMRLRSVSPELFEYDFLTSVYLDHNLLTYLPAAIRQLRNLTVLNVSGNRLTSVPPELGMLTRLKELLLFDNLIQTLPFELGTLYNLEMLGLEGNPIQDPFKSLLQKEGTHAALAYLRDNAPAPSQPKMREWVTLDKEAARSGTEIVSVLSYNILSSRYATPQSYGYVPTWALNWDYRKDFILQEILGLSADIVCLQEVEASQFDDFFKEQMAKEGGYEGVFWIKSRARTMTDQERKGVDGCAIFFKSAKFSLVEKHLIEFQQAALQRKDFEKSDDAFNRFMTKDNITGFAVLEHTGTHNKLLVANSHIHWDPEYTDVKVVQVAMLLEEIEQLTVKHGALLPSAKASMNAAAGRPALSRPKADPANYYLATVMCGDFNSTPNSGVVEYVTRGALNKDHNDLGKCTYSKFMTEGFQHSLALKSAYATVGELPFTNFSPTFKDVIDYIFYSNGTLTPTGLLGAADAEYIKNVVGFPNVHFPSDHISLMAEFRWKSSPPTSTAGASSHGTAARASFGQKSRPPNSLPFNRSLGSAGDNSNGSGNSSQFRKTLSFKK
ncbi:Glucose-repressible alcohol dehydrogenase transcriptional effector [Dimargaris xerosporica]|nr:Glucose-repressible alcohol dehydrogenase transcriptional effector [Dimargaris xerosporica]